MSEKKTITQYFIFKNWQPLAFTWILMAIEIPLVSAILARGDDPQYNLAAFGISFALCLLIESPVIMMMTTSLRLVRGKNSYLKLKKFSHTLCLTMTLLMVILLLPGPYQLWSHNILHLEPKLSHLVHEALWFFLAWPGMIGYRRFYQGLLIITSSNKRIAYGTLVRFFALILSFMILSYTTKLEGVRLAALAMSLGVTCEALCIRLLVIKSIQSIKRKTQDEIPSYFEITKFYYPLALTTMIGLSAQPIASYAALHAPMSLKSLAILPVLNAFIFFFKAMCLSFQEVIISLIGEDHENHKALKNFALGLGTLLTVTFLVLAYTPLNYFWLNSISGLSNELTEFSILPLKLMVLVPLLTLYICWQRSIFIALKKTKIVTYASLSEVIAIVLSLFLLIKLTQVNGALCVMLALTIGRIASSLYLNSVRKSKMIR